MATPDGIFVPTGAGAEQARLQALEELCILDTPPEPVFDDLAWLAAQLCSTPISLISLVDADRQWFKARCGLNVQQTPRGDSFCAHAIEHEDWFEIEDALLDERFAANPLVTGAPGIRFYAGVPLVARHGQRVGTLCVIDTRPRTLGAHQREGLLRLAQRAADSLELRRQRLHAEARERTLAQLLEAMPDAVITCGADGLLGELNPVARQWHGFDAHGLPAQEWAHHLDLYTADGQQPLAADRVPLLRAWKGERVRAAAMVIRAAGQPPRTVLCNADPLCAADGTLLGAVCVMHDITGRLAAEDRVRESELRMRTVADNVPALIAQVGTDLRYQFVNRPYARWFGLEPGAVEGRHMSEILPREHYLSVLPRMQQVLAGEALSCEMELPRHDGALRHVRAAYLPDGLPGSGGQGASRIEGFHLMVHDLTEQTQLARMLHERAMTDALTGLPNRAAWNAELERAVARAQRSGVPATVMFLDLDDFKQVNDTHGQAAGDAMLCELAHRLRRCLRRNDFTARVAGDEFMVVLDRLANPDIDPPLVARKVLLAMQAEFRVDHQPLRIRPSIGIAVQKGPRYEAAQLMQTVDQAMYLAKRARHTRFAVLEC